MAIKKKTLFLTGALAVAIVGGCLVVINNNNTSTSNYTEEQIREKDIKTYYSFSGDVVAKNSEAVNSNSEIEIEEILVKEGDKVKEGDTLFKTASENKIKAKMDGIVAEILVHTDVKYISGTHLATIVDNSSLQVEIKIDEYDANLIKIGDEAEVYINALDKTVDGKVINLAKSATVSNGVSYFRAVVEIEDTTDILTGMSTEVKILKEEAKSVKTISLNAVEFDEDNQPYVYIKGSNGNPIKKSVSIGINDGLSVEIKSGLKDSDTVLLSDKVFNPFEMMHNGGN